MGPISGQCLSRSTAKCPKATISKLREYPTISNLAEEARQDLRKHHLPRFLPFIHGQVVAFATSAERSLARIFFIYLLNSSLRASSIWLNFAQFIIVLLINMHVRVFRCIKLYNHIYIYIYIHTFSNGNLTANTRNIYKLLTAFIHINFILIHYL